MLSEQLVYRQTTVGELELESKAAKKQTLDATGRWSRPDSTRASPSLLSCIMGQGSSKSGGSTEPKGGKKKQFEGRCVTTFTGHKDAVLCLAFSPDDKFLVTGSADKKGVVWEAATGRPLRQLAAHKHDVTGCGFASVDGSVVVTASRDGTAIVWTSRSAQPRRYGGHEGAVLGCAVSPDLREVATCSQDNTIHLWKVETVTTVCEMRGHRGAVLACVFSPDGVSIASASQDRTLRLWNRNSGRSISVIDDPFISCAVTFSPDGVRLAGAGGDRTVRVWNVNSGEVVSCLEGEAEAVQTCHFSPDGRTLASGGGDRTVKIWNTDGALGEVVLKLPTEHTDWVQCCRFSHKGKRLATASSDKTAKVWQ